MYAKIAFHRNFVLFLSAKPKIHVFCRKKKLVLILLKVSNGVRLAYSEKGLRACVTGSDQIGTYDVEHVV